MTAMDKQILLRDPEVFPSDDVLKNTLGDMPYGALESFLTAIAEYGLTVDWRFYNDGKAWLGKVTNGKKTVLWLSVWEGFFRTSFFFTEKHLEAIAALDISATIGDRFAEAKPVGRLIPMLIDVSAEKQLTDLLTVTRFKISLK